jgi:hypothetical protein
MGYRAAMTVRSKAARNAETMMADKVNAKLVCDGVCDWTGAVSLRKGCCSSTLSRRRFVDMS